MSIKTIGQQTQSNTKGLEKIINKGAERLVIDVLQSTQYSTPIPSTVRELVTNACDSQREKEIAIEILTGKAKIEDYFITRDGDEYSDSNFDSSYYDVSRLDPLQNAIRVKYIENDDGTGFCDTVVIEDYGVGIGERRLEGMLELGYSTKRNTSENFGAFGLGSKIALSTGVPHYTIETAHNGKLFKMNCYPYKTDFIISKWDADGEITLSNGDTAYYKNIDGYNYTKISFGSKKHNRRAFSNAIKEQLSYISNVEYYTHYSDKTVYKELIKKDILINTPSCIVAEGSSWYAKPHIVIVKKPGDSVGINYGSIDFRELEMEDLHGNIGIKCPMRQSYIDENNEEIILQEGVDVTPSREKVIWNENTKEYVQGMVEKAADEAADIIQEALKEDDFIEWIKLCTNILYKNSGSEDSSNDLVGLNQIARMVDTSKIRPMFKTSGIRFASPKKMFAGYRIRTISRSGNGVQRTELDDWTSANMSRVYVSDEGGAVKTKDLYLTLGNDHTFILISPVGTDYLADDILKESRPEIKQKLQAEKKKYEQHKQVISTFLATHTSSTHNYSELEVPEDILATIEDLEKKDTTDSLSPAELRKFQQKIVGYSLRRKYFDESWVWDKVEPSISTVLESCVSTYYGTSEDNFKLKLAAEILSKRVPTWGKVSKTGLSGDWEKSSILFRDAVPSNSWEKRHFHHVCDENTSEAPQLIRLSVMNCKYARKNPEWKHIDDFFFTSNEEGDIIVSEYLKPILTSVCLFKRQHSWHWLKGYVAQRLLTPAFDAYLKISTYMHNCYNIKSFIDVYDTSEDGKKTTEFLEYIINFIEYQDICDTNDVSLRQQKSQQFFVIDVPNIDAYDKDSAKLRTVFDDLSDTIGSWMEDFGSRSIKHDEIFKIVFNSYNKFDIEIPEVEVPELRYTFTPRS